jgi:hypothetical protein
MEMRKPTKKKNLLIIPGVPAEMRNEHHPNTSIYVYRHGNQFCSIGLCFTEQYLFANDKSLQRNSQGSDGRGHFYHNDQLNK